MQAVEVQQQQSWSWEPREAWTSLHPKQEMMLQVKGKCSSLMPKLEEFEKIVG